ncbi:hypothetical protein ANN_18459 [Periplaneta americana]|uniref:Reverse transcriptase domain-containing protein n=1 Tax=Periplaneta americana TaxID=6978 RepID=A0ABQ8SQX0_PERAM|nr:hypothetical protein ANN_18459 [Periplaneta americana]
MSPGSSAEIYPVFALNELRGNPGKNLKHVTCSKQDLNPGPIRFKVKLRRSVLYSYKRPTARQQISFTSIPRTSSGDAQRGWLRDESSRNLGTQRTLVSSASVGWECAQLKNMGGVILEGRRIKCIRFADDMALLAESEMILRDMLLELNDSCEQYGMKINANKTKTMMEKFKYLGAGVTNINDTREEIKHRINMGNACYSVEKLLSSSLLSKNLKVRIYKTVILPVVLYGWTLTLREEHKLRVFENKVIRKIFGANRDEVTGEWRKLHNTELHALYSSPDIIRNIKSRRLRAGHVARMGESINAYRVLVRRPEG